ncbi:MAG: hypothetical protein HQL80_13100 [Magnetococcales bacterium]|nr:hypothetical protein [Magnetococcales bacterium]
MSFGEYRDSENFYDKLTDWIYTDWEIKTTFLRARDVPELLLSAFSKNDARRCLNELMNDCTEAPRDYFTRDYFTRNIEVSYELPLRELAALTAAASHAREAGRSYVAEEDVALGGMLAKVCGVERNDQPDASRKITWAVGSLGMLKILIRTP